VGEVRRHPGAEDVLWIVASLGSVYAGYLLALGEDPLAALGIASQVPEVWLGFVLLAAGGIDLIETLTKIGVMDR